MRGARLERGERKADVEGPSPCRTASWSIGEATGGHRAYWGFRPLSRAVVRVNWLMRWAPAPAPGVRYRPWRAHGAFLRVPGPCIRMVEHNEQQDA
jgi:hypothetical protein